MTKNKDELNQPVLSIAFIAKIGFVIVILFFGILGLWITFAPLESASVASGKVIVATYKKTVQHLEGGIIKQIFVKEGSHVKMGSPLVQLDDTQPRAIYDSVHKQVSELTAGEARLTAERDNADIISFPANLSKEQHDPVIAKILQTQEAQFQTNRRTLSGQLEIYQQRIAQLEKEIQSIEAQVKSEDTQLEVINKEIKAVAYLEAKRLIEKPRLWALQREAARIEGNRGEHLALISRAQQKIGETKQEILTLKDTYLKNVLQELRDTQMKLTTLVEKEKSTEDILKRTTITAPQDGVVVNMQEHTVGGVILPGKPILDIVPSQDKLIIEARINPLDIDSVHAGLPAYVQLVAYKQRSTPQLDGVVESVSADSFEDPQTREPYYLAYINVSPEQLSRLKHVRLYPGMPVQVMIISGRRSALNYLLSPITESFQRAFREQ